VRLWFVLAALLVAGCSHKIDVPPAPVKVSGPKFPATAFECGSEPAPPDPKTIGPRGGSAAAHYENSLRSYGNGCRRKLNSVGSQLRAGGQVVP
jgi:hypothetical protein